MAASGAPGSVDEGSGVAHGVTSRAASDRSGAAQQLEPVSAERLQSLKDESRPLRLSPTLSEHLQNVEVSPEEGFLLSRIDGSSRAREILSLSPMPEPDSAGALIELLNKGLIYWGGSANSNVVRKKAQPTEKAKPNGALDAQVLAELDRLLRLAEEDDFAALLGLEPGAPESARKSSYRKLIGKFHPDKFARSDDVIHAKLSRLCAAASEGLTELAKPPEQRSLSQAASEGKGNDSDSGFDKQSYGRELYDRGLRAFDSHDFWDAIQLARQAIEVDDQQAEFFALLGRSLMQNKKWRKEAADSFHRASELDPDNVEFLGMLGAIYQAVGLATRAQTILEKAQAIDPAYELPELEPEPTFSD